MKTKTAEMKSNRRLAAIAVIEADRRGDIVLRNQALATFAFYGTVAQAEQTVAQQMARVEKAAL